MIKSVMLIFYARIVISSFEYKGGSPVNLFPSYTAVSQYQDGGSITNPAYLPLADNTYLHVSMDNPYSIDGLYSSNIAAGSSKGIYGYQFAWRRFGIREYMENIFEANAGIMPVKWISAGAGASYYCISITSGEISFKSRLLDYRGSVHVTPFSWLDFSYEQDNIISMIHGNREDLLYPEKRFGIALMPVRGFSLSWNRNWSITGTADYFSFETRLLPFLMLRGGYSREASTYAAALSVAYDNFILSYSVRYHSFLGITHSLGFTTCYNRVKYDNIDYYGSGKKNTEDIRSERVNINTCSEDELKKIPILNDGLINRITRHREIIGPLSKKSLSQIGLTGKDIDRLMDFVFGLVEDKKEWGNKNEKKGMNKTRGGSGAKGISLDARKRIFEGLIKAGLSANLSLIISEAAIKGDRKQLINVIHTLPELTEARKKEIIKICFE